MFERSGSIFRRAATVVTALAVVATLSACDPVVRARIASGSSRSAPPTAEETQVISAVNRYRSAHHLGALRWNANLSDKAKLWAAYMAGGNCGRTVNGVPTICHSNLASGITVRWTLLEENVGAATPRSNLSGVLNAFERSPEHAQNMLNPRITWIGAGVRHSGNMIFVAEEFMAS
jgi:uncharacterized protein YkwD